MSWEVLSALLVRFELSSDEQGKVQLGRLDEEKFLRWYTRLAGLFVALRERGPGAEQTGKSH